MRGVGGVVRVVDGEVVDRRHNGLGDGVEGGGEVRCQAREFV